jgi:phospholipase C
MGRRSVGVLVGLVVAVMAPALTATSARSQIAGGSGGTTPLPTASTPVTPIATGASAATTAASPNAINHIVVLMQENRSADHYLGQLHFEGQNQFDPEPPGASNPNPVTPSGPPIPAFHKTSYCEVADLNHSWNGTHQEIDNGLMDGFTAANVNSNDPTGSRTMGYYDQTDLPFYYAMYKTFATSDRYFASAPTQTFPNRFYLLAGTSFGHIANDLPNLPSQTGFNQPTIFNLLDAAHITWKVYFSQVPFAGLFTYVQQHPLNLAPVAQYYVDAATGNLPQVSFVDPIFVATAQTETDEHPPSNVQVGEYFSASVINALMHSPNWSSSALFFTYDEHGGFYDHVAPPAAVTPDDIPPMLAAGDTPGQFNEYGIRVPVAVISPFSKPGYVSHVVNDHTSILKFIETRFGLPSLTRRDAAASPMLDFFDFSRASFASPPTLPAAPINLLQWLLCLTAPPNTGV